MNDVDFVAIGIRTAWSSADCKGNSIDQWVDGLYARTYNLRTEATPTLLSSLTRTCNLFFSRVGSD